MSKDLYNLIENEDVRKLYQDKNIELTNYDIAYLIQIADLSIDKKRALIKENEGEFTNRLLKRYEKLEKQFKKCSEYSAMATIAYTPEKGWIKEFYDFDNLDDLLKDLEEHNDNYFNVYGKYNGSEIYLEYYKGEGITNYRGTSKDDDINNPGFYHPFKLGDTVIFCDDEFEITSIKLKDDKTTRIEILNDKELVELNPVFGNYKVVKKENNL